MPKKSLKETLIHNVSEDIKYNSAAREILKKLPDGWDGMNIPPADSDGILAIFKAIEDVCQEEQPDSEMSASILSSIRIFDLGRAYQQIINKKEVK